MVKLTIDLLKKEYGDFQTPVELSKKMISILDELNFKPYLIIEPTCGIGNILLDAHKHFLPKKTIGVEINKEYCNRLSDKIGGQNIRLYNLNIFTAIDVIKKETKSDDNFLFIGNPPWVTNSELSALESGNMPQKSNIKNVRGIEALTGKSNFDICEYIISKLVLEFVDKNAVFAFLCKTSVARNVLKFLWNNGVLYKESFIYPIDAKKYFDASADACFFIFEKTRKNNIKECKVFDSIETKKFINKLGLYKGKMVADVDNPQYYGYMGKCEYNWRNGIKHDCSKVMEFDIKLGKLINGYGETVNIENDLLYPLLKSSDIANGTQEVRKMVLITQKQIGENTDYIKNKYPKTWEYLNAHIDDFNKRKSVVYKNKPLFSVFSVGEYTFEPYKIAISSLYKKLKFKLVLPIDNKPVIVDDTCNYISCKSLDEANKIYSLLNNKKAKDFFNSIIFWDSKRPITTEVLNSFNFGKKDMQMKMF